MRSTAWLFRYILYSITILLLIPVAFIQGEYNFEPIIGILSFNGPMTAVYFAESMGRTKLFEESPQTKRGKEQ